MLSNTNIPEYEIAQESREGLRQGGQRKLVFFGQFCLSQSAGL